MSKSVALQIEGMTCGHCAMAVTKELSKLKGADAVSVDPQAGTATLKLDEAVDIQAIAAAVDEAGYKLVSMNA